MPIEQHAPGLERIVDLHQEIEELAQGFGGEGGPLRAQCGGRKVATSSSAISAIIGACSGLRGQE
jgi:hypothetical protein